MVNTIKFFQVAAILFLSFFWNKFILKKIQNLISNGSDKISNNSFSSSKNETKIIKFLQYFYWFVAIIVSILLVIQ